MSEPASAAGWLARAAAFLEEHDVPEPSANAEFLLAEVLGIGRGGLVLAGPRPLAAKQSRRYWELVKSRGRRLPLAYVLGWQPFAGCRIKVTPAVLVPRPETEELVDLAVAEAKVLDRHPLHVVDVGTGSGCVAIALAKRLPDAQLYATDLSPAVLKLAEENAVANHVSRRIRVVRENLFKPHAGSPWADMAVSNPPYIPTADLAGLEPEVQAEPRLALDGGRDGLDALRAIAADAKRLVKPGGRLLLEFGDGQAGSVRGLLAEAGLTSIRIAADLQKKERFCVAVV